MDAATRFTGKVWCVGDDVDTDLILPGSVIPLRRMERPAHMFEANRPGWAQEVEPGDILVAGANFGMGSSRPASQVMKDLGLACLLAEGINGLFFRNCVNFALPALEIKGISKAFTEGDTAEVDFAAGTVINTSTGTELSGPSWPEFAMKIYRSGGIIASLEDADLLEPPEWTPLEAT